MDGLKELESKHVIPQFPETSTEASWLEESTLPNEEAESSEDDIVETPGKLWAMWDIEYEFYGFAAMIAIIGVCGQIGYWFRVEGPLGENSLILPQTLLVSIMITALGGVVSLTRVVWTLLRR